MSWIELQWGVPRKLVDLLSSSLFELQALGVQEDYLPGEKPPPRHPWDTGPKPPEPPNILLKAWWEARDVEQIQLSIQALQHRFPETMSVSWSRVVETDWGEDWKQNFHRHQISERLAVSPPWCAQKGDVVIEPGIAFGTGEHPTTFSCLEAIAQWAVPNQSCLDVGCGSGILALAAAHLGMNARGVDIEEQAIQAAKENARQNGLQAQFEQTDVFDITEKYSIVVANLYAEVLVALAPAILDRCEGKLALAGILISKEEMVLQAYQSRHLLRRKVDGDWVSLWFSV